MFDFAYLIFYQGTLFLFSCCPLSLPFLLLPSPFPPPSLSSSPTPFHNVLMQNKIWEAQLRDVTQ